MISSTLINKGIAVHSLADLVCVWGGGGGGGGGGGVLPASNHESVEWSGAARRWT